MVFIKDLLVSLGFIFASFVIDGEVLIGL